MAENKLKWFITLLLYLICISAYAQKNAPIKNGLLFEKVYLHTDQNTYVAGDTLWYKAYLTDPVTGQLANTSSNLYVELIAPADTLVSRQTIKLNYGLGNGDLTLPDQLPSGTYMLRAYTNWMRNFGDTFIFEYPLVIEGVDAPSVLQPTEPGRKYQPTIALVNKPADTPITVGFYPEGGAMVNSINSVIAVNVQAKYQSFDLGSVRGSVMDRSGKKVAQFSCDSLGMARFDLVPLAVGNYTAQITYGNTVLTLPLPIALHSGYTLHILKQGTNTKAIIKADAGTLTSPKGSKVMLVGKHAGQIVFTEPVLMENRQDEIDIPVESLPAGITTLILYDTQKRPQAERLIFKQPDPNVRLVINGNQARYKPKEKVDMSINITDATGRPVEAALSLAVVSAPYNNADNIVNYLLLRSEIKGNIRHIHQYFDTTNVNREQQLDMLLLTQGWRSYIWHHTDTPATIAYKPEHGFTLKGRLRQKFINNPLPNKKIVATVLQGRTDSHMYLAITDSSGRYQFDSLDVKGRREVQLSALDDRSKSLGWLLVDSVRADVLPIVKRPSASQPGTKVAEPTLLNRVVTRRNKAIQLRSVVVKSARTVILNGVTLTLFRPDQMFNIGPKDHPYKTLEWFALQKVRGARTCQNIDTTDVCIPVNGKLVPIALYADNFFVFPEDRAKYYELGIEYYQNVTLRHFITMGGSDFFVLYLTTKPGAFKSPDVTKATMDIDGYYQARKFYQPAYDASATPNERSTLHWIPNLDTNGKGKASVSFYNTAATGKVHIIVQGITSTGVPVHSTVTYEVK